MRIHSIRASSFTMVTQPASPLALSNESNQTHPNDRIGNDEGEKIFMKFLGLLDLPQGSVIHLDGIPVALRRDDFVGFINLPQHNNDSDDGRASNFHFVSIQAGSIKSQTSGGGCMDAPLSTSVGFVLPHHGNMIRRFDPQTEEVSSIPIDDPLTVTNLQRQLLQPHQMAPHRVLNYSSVVSNTHQTLWKQQTRFISTRLLALRGIVSGDKLVPGAYNEQGDKQGTTMEIPPSSPPPVVDGKSICYPPIPIFLRTNLQQRHQHHITYHWGTKQVLARLANPSERTQWLLDAHPSTRAIQYVLRNYYNDSWYELLGDIQFAFLMFHHLHCYASFQHWRDLVVLLTTIDDTSLLVRKYVDLYTNLVEVLSTQLEFMDVSDLWLDDDAESSSEEENDGNFLIPSLQQLLHTLSRLVPASSPSPGMDDRRIELERLCASQSQLHRVLQEKFPTQFHSTDRKHHVADHPSRDDRMEEDTADESVMEDEDDEDGPVVVPVDEVEASLHRIAAKERLRLHQRKQRGMMVEEDDYPVQVRQHYPLLFASKLDTEDIVMTCSRVLDEAVDVSLVREAADYLENVEAYRTS